MLKVTEALINEHKLCITYDSEFPDDFYLELRIWANTVSEHAGCIVSNFSDSYNSGGASCDISAFGVNIFQIYYNTIVIVVAQFGDIKVNSLIDFLIEELDLDIVRNTYVPPEPPPKKSIITRFFQAIKQLL